MFLRKVALGEKVDIGDRVLVLGGGNSAMDAARTSVRLGAKQVQVVYRRTRNEMPANVWEIEEAEEEGVEFLYLAAPVKCEGDEGVEGLVCQQMELGEPDESGRRKPVPADMAPFVLQADSIIAAVGQQPDFEPFKGDESIKLNRWGYMEADPHTLMTSKPGVFVGGDAVSGGGTVIEAINAGKVVAKYIDKYLRGEPVVEDIEDKTKRLAVYLGAQKSAEPLADCVDYGKRQKMPVLPVDVRKQHLRCRGAGLHAGAGDRRGRSLPALPPADPGGRVALGVDAPGKREGHPRSLAETAGHVYPPLERLHQASCDGEAQTAAPVVGWSVAGLIETVEDVR